MLLAKKGSTRPSLMEKKAIGVDKVTETIHMAVTTPPNVHDFLQKDKSRCP